MNAFVQVALIEKAKRVFAVSEKTFLSFPFLSPIAFEARDLGRIASPQTIDDYRLAGEFARIVNFLPRDVVASIDADALLWDVYRDVLDRAQVGASTVDPEVEAKHAAAKALLHELGPQGTTRDTQAYLDYRRYRDAWIVAQEDYAAQRISGEAATDAEAQRRWREEEEPALRAALAAAAHEWETLGHRSTIEAALAQETASMANDPKLRWEEWRAAFIPEIDMVNDAVADYAPTSFSPTDIDDASDWLHTGITRQEMSVLVAGAAPEMRSIAESIDDEGIQRIAFDFRSVALNRPWFRSEALTSRVWRTNDEALLLSDGAEPPSGRCPAYVSALVFVRNLTIIRSGTDTPQKPRDEPSLLFSPQFAKLSQRPVTKGPERQIVVASVAAQASANIAPQASIRGQERLTSSTFKVVPRMPTAAIRPTLSVAPSARVVEPSTSAALKAQSLDRTSILVRPTILVRPGKVPVSAPPGPVGVPSPPPKTTTTTTVDTSVAVLAFICKKLPKTPDPLPDLVWGASNLR